MDDGRLFFSGIDGEDGTYLTPPTPRTEMVRRILDGDNPVALPADEGEATRDPRRVSLAAVDPRNLARTGWGLIYPAGLDPRIKRALEPLRELRRRQVGRRDRYHEIRLHPREGAERLLSRLEAGRGAVLRPERVPYYLLLVGDPRTIPLEVQLELAGSYAVGRLAFETPQEYEAYARGVVASERRPRRPREVGFFGVENAGDGAMERIRCQLVEPLAKRVASATGATGGFRVRRVVGHEATKPALGRLLGGEETPAVLFTASHGLGYPAAHPLLQRERQGALLTSEMDGPFEEPRPVPPEAVFAADDVAEEADLRGLIAMHFACYSAGTPAWDSFARGKRTPEDARAPEAFLARLPERLLGHPRGALAVIGHVDRAWSTSFSWRGEGSQPAAYEGFFELLLSGYPVGAALDPLRELWNSTARTLNTLLAARERQEPFDESRLLHYWTAAHDLQGFALLGDPAVRVS